MIVGFGLDELILLSVLVGEGRDVLDTANRYDELWFSKENVKELTERIYSLEDKARDLADKEDQK